MYNNIILSRVCHRFENKPIQINYNDSVMKQQISKMLKDGSYKLTYYEYMMMECCLLFLCGFSFSEIANKTHIYDKAVIKFLESDKLLELLSDEYLMLFENNKYRLEVDVNEDEKIKKAITTYIEQDGNVTKTCNILYIYPAIFRKYLKNPDLERIIGDSDLYYKFMLLSGVKNKQFNVESDREKYLNVVSELLKLKPCSDDEMNYLNIAKVILIKELNSVDRIVDYTGLSHESVIYYLKRFSQCKTFFSRHVMSMLLLKSMFILNKHRDVFSYDEFVQVVISTYMNSRYTIDDLAGIYNVEKKDVEYIINEKSKEMISDSEYQDLIKHNNELVDLEQNCPDQHYIVKDPKIISILKEDVVYVDECQYMLLNVLCECLENYNRMYYYDIKQTFFSEMKYLNSNIDSFEEIFNSLSFNIIKRALEIECFLYSSSLREKNRYVWDVMKQFINYGMDLEKTSDQLDINIPILIRILQDQAISTYYGTVLSEYIKKAIEDYRVRYKKKYGNQIVDYTKLKVLKRK